MKKFTLIILILFPCITFGQLLPKIPDFKGNVKQVTEKRFGKEFNLFGLLKKTHYPELYSGWKYAFQFNKQSKLINQTATFHREIESEYIYEYDTIENRCIVREITSNKSKKDKGDYTEYEEFKNTGGFPEKVISRAFNSKDNTKDIFLIEQNAEYSNDKLMSFTRRNISSGTDLGSEEKCSLYYNSSGQLIRLERKNLETELATILYYSYNNKGFVDHYSIDYMADMVEFGSKKQLQEVYFEYDSHGNWTKKYWKSGKEGRLEAKRKVKYW